MKKSQLPSPQARQDLRRRFLQDGEWASQHEEGDGRVKKCHEGQDGENLDGMIRRMDSPFTTEVLNCSLPLKFCLPQLESYDSSKDPLDHIESFKILMLLQITPDEVLCRAFPTTLKGATRIWFTKIPSGTIADFEQLSKGFVHHFIGGVDTQEANQSSSQHSTGRRRITKTVCDLIQ